MNTVIANMKRTSQEFKHNIKDFIEKLTNVLNQLELLPDTSPVAGGKRHCSRHLYHKHVFLIRLPYEYLL